MIPAKRRQKKVESNSPISGVTAVSRVVGPYLLLENITQEYGLDAMLKKCFPNKWQLMLSLVYFIGKGGVGKGAVPALGISVCVEKG